MKKKLVIIFFITLILILFKFYNVQDYLTLEYIKANQEAFREFYLQNTWPTISLYFVIYIVTTALSLPGATILTLLGGGLFGFTKGLVIISFASSIGASLAFLMSRTLLRDWVENKFAKKIEIINRGVEREGAFYLLTLRLVPLFPFFLINLTMGLTAIRLPVYYLVSQIGMLPGTAVYVNAGVQLSQLESLKGILSAEILFSFTLLGLFPLISKRLIDFVKARKVYAKFKKPNRFDYNMVVIGAGSAGLVTAYICSAVKARVALIEKEAMGGDCLNTGCVPSKALISSAKVAHTIKMSSDYGITTQGIEIDFAKAMERVQSVIKKIEPHDSIERYTGLGVECIQGEAKMISPWEVKVGDRILRTKNITIATGASPLVPSIKGLDEISFLTSNNLWQIRKLPKRFLVLGGGPIGLEMAQSFARFGSEVTVLEMGERVLAKEDPDVSSLVEERLKLEAVNILTGHRAVEFKNDGQRKLVICEHNEKRVEIEFDEVLLALGRKANIHDFCLEDLGIGLRGNGTIEANEYLQTNYPNIYVCGDVTGPFQLTHTASHQAWYCAVNALFSPFKKFKVDYSVIPWCTYIDPEVATVGRNELACKQEKIDYEVTKYNIDDLDRAIADGSDYGMVKVITKKGSDKILGATIVGKNAGELLIEFVTSMKHNKGLNSILGTIHSYPTLAEANKFVAGNWKKATAPVKLLKLVEKFHSYRR